MPGLEPGTVQVVQSLAEARLLRQVITPLAFAEGAWTHCLPNRLRRGLSTRLLPAALAGRATYYPVRESIRVLARLAGLSDRFRDRIWYWAETGFDRHVARVWAGRSAFIYGCEHASFETFIRQKRRGGRTILWQVIAHPHFLNRMIRQELDRFPETGTSYTRLWLHNLEQGTWRKMQQFAHTDLVVANSPFVRRTFLEGGFPPERVICVPTGCPPSSSEAEAVPPSPRTLTILNAGALSVRKGIHLLIDAWRRLRPPAAAELLLHGNLQLPAAYRHSLPRGVRFAPRLPRPELHALFRRSVAFVLPTLAEGRANVILEALANGLPVITTPNSGCTDVVMDGRTGFLVPPGDIEALGAKLAWCLDHPRELAEMRPACLQAARGWQSADFRREHANKIRAFITASTAMDVRSGFRPDGNHWQAHRCRVGKPTEPEPFSDEANLHRDFGTPCEHAADVENRGRAP
jgi:glycosyltransferase involved in cell wall biosynthesis